MVQTFREKVWGWRGIVFVVMMVVVAGQYLEWWGGATWPAGVACAICGLLLIALRKKPAKRE